MSLSGSVSTGYDGAHELVVGGYKQVVDALAEGRAGEPGTPPQPLRDVRLNAVATAVRLLPGGAGVEVDVAGQARRGRGGGTAWGQGLVVPSGRKEC
jgi:hypothetical protein